MPMDVLLVEDSPGDVRLTQEAFRDANRSIHLHVAADGVEAMAFLRHEGVHINAPRPDLILLDLNLPKMDGREVLVELKSDPGLRTIPVVVITTSSAEEDVVQELRPAGELLCHQTGRPQAVSSRRRFDRRFLVAGRPPTTQGRVVQRILLIEDNPGRRRADSLALVHLAV